MSHKKKFFVMSDLHGHYSLAKQALDDAGFDPNNEDHVFVHCGDLFDRGDENKKVFELVSSLKNKILVKNGKTVKKKKENGEKLKNKFKLIIGCLNLMWILCLRLS